MPARRTSIGLPSVPVTTSEGHLCCFAAPPAQPHSLHERHPQCQWDPVLPSSNKRFSSLERTDYPMLRRPFHMNKHFDRQDFKLCERLVIFLTIPSSWKSAPIRASSRLFQIAMENRTTSFTSKACRDYQTELSVLSNSDVYHGQIKNHMLPCPYLSAALNAEADYVFLKINVSRL